MSYLAVRDLRFSYPKTSDELFGGLTHTFDIGAVTALTGSSGRGKSTLLYILGLLLRPSAGEVVLAGEAVSGQRDWQLSRRRSRDIGFVFQDATLDPRKTVLQAVLEPVLYSGGTPGEREEDAVRLLTSVGVDHRAGHRPSEISGGQAQRVAVCRALINNPAVVLADEPTGNLDADNSSEVLKILRANSEGRSVVIATHDPFVMDRCDHVLRLT